MLILGLGIGIALALEVYAKEKALVKFCCLSVVKVRRLCIALGIGHCT